MKFSIKNIFSYLIILIFSIPLILPFLKKGYFITHDGEWAIVRLSAFNTALRDGQLIPRWAGNLFHSFGYPIFNFNYPLPYMIGEALHLVGFGFVDAVKGVFILSIIFSAIFMYLLCKELFGKTAGVFGALLYLYYPFRMVDLFVRGSIGESLVFAILPLIYWSIIKLQKIKNKKWVAITSLSIAALILAHNSLALVSLLFVILFMIFLLKTEKKRKKLIYCFTASLLFAFCLSCFFWLPALYEKQWVILNPETITQPTKHFPALKSLFISSWGFGQSKAIDSLSFQLGPIHLLLLLITVILFFVSKKENNKKIIGFFLAVFFINLFFLLPVSGFLWKNLPLIAYVSYPWRLLVPIGFYLSVIGVFAFGKIKNSWLLTGIIAVFFVFLFFQTRNYRKPREFINRDEMFYITNQSTTIEGDENTPVWVKIPPKHAPKDKIELEGKYEIISQKSNLLSFDIYSEKTQKVFVNTIYYPGWKLFVNGKEEKIDYENDRGLISFQSEIGEKNIKLVFNETLLRLFSDIISLFSLTLIIYLLSKK